MVNNLIDLPDVVLLEILSYITNIREKIRLSRVCSRFRSIVSEALKIQEYKIVNKDDYLYKSELNRVSESQESYLPLGKLVEIAPKLTHYVDKMYHISYEIVWEHGLPYQEIVPLPNLKYIYIDLCHEWFFGRPYTTIFDRKSIVLLDQCPNLRTLDLRCDSKIKFSLSKSIHLKTLRISYFSTSKYPRHLESNFFNFLGATEGQTPNLEEFSFISQYVYPDTCLIKTIGLLAVHCPKLKYFQAFFQLSEYTKLTIDNAKAPFDDKYKLNQLEYLDIRGIILHKQSWQDILKLCPNLKFLVYDIDSDQDSMMHIVKYFAPNVKFNHERPFEIEEEYRVYNYRNRSSDSGRFL